MQAITVGEKFPGAYPQQEHAVMVMTVDGPMVLIQYPTPSRQELQAFKKSFKTYGYLESETPVPIAVWTFNFPSPFNPIDVNFDARAEILGGKGRILERYLAGGGNMITFVVLDGPIVRAIKTVGTSHDAAKRFRETLGKQAAMNYTPADFSKYLSGLFQYTTDELFQLSKQYKQKKG